MKKRFLFDQLQKQINHKNALVITGMRQVGKTTLMKQLYDQVESPAKLWFDFDNPLDTKPFENTDYQAIFTNLIKSAPQESRLFLFIDEIQNYPEITKVIKYGIDHFGIKFVVTGSSNYYLKNLFPESLSGRKFLYQLDPLNFKEYLYFHNKIDKSEATNTLFPKASIHKSLYQFKLRETYYQDFLRYGGFPEVVTTKDPDTKTMILKNIFASFFEKDLKLLSDYTDTRELRDLILLLVPRVGSLLDISKLASELSVDRKKIYSYLEFLQGTFFIKLLPKFSRSIDRTVAGGKKVYFSDSGILNTIGKVNDSQLFENTVISQLYHYGSLSFYNKRNTAEIDAILDNKIALEIKLTGTEAYLKKASRISQSLNIDQTYVISQSYQEEPNIIFPHFL